MQPEIIQRPKTKVIGMANHYDENDLNLELLWSHFHPDIPQIANRSGCHAFGIYEEYEESDGKMGFTYICSVAVESFDSVPEGMICRTIPEHLYAVFLHEGDIVNASLKLTHLSTLSPK